MPYDIDFSSHKLLLAQYHSSFLKIMTDFNRLYINYQITSLSNYFQFILHKCNSHGYQSGNLGSCAAKKGKESSNINNFKLLALLKYGNGFEVARIYIEWRRCMSPDALPFPKLDLTSSL